MRKRKQLYEVNIAPLIDVVFILLAFILIYSKIETSKSIEVTLPEVSGEKNQTKQKVIEVAINKHGDIFIAQTLFTKEEFSDKLMTFNKNDTLTIKADKFAPSETLIWIMKTCADLGWPFADIQVSGT